MREKFLNSVGIARRIVKATRLVVGDLSCLQGKTARHAPLRKRGLAQQAIDHSSPCLSPDLAICLLIQSSIWSLGQAVDRLVIFTPEGKLPKRICL